MKLAFASRNPEKNYGKAAWSEIAGTILATDYKAPPLCLIVYEEGDSDKHDRGRLCFHHRDEV